MCTAITLQTKQKETIFGRNMDFSYQIIPTLFIVPANHVWTNVIDGKHIQDKHRFMAIGEEKDNILGFFDGVNDKGFSAATLFFAGYASYCNPTNVKEYLAIAALDFLHYILGQCESVDELSSLINHIALIGLPDPITQNVAPLHWIATDKSGKCVVIEHSHNGFHLYNNTIGVMANSPDFPWHMTNLRNYMEVSPYQTSEAYWGDIKLTPFGQGGATVPLPGGFTSPERFVRSAYRKTHIPIPRNRTEAVVSCFHILEGVAITQGAVITERDKYDYTKYSCSINTNTSEYYFRTYDNSQITAVSLFDTEPHAKEIVNLGTLSRPIVFQTI